MTDGGPIRRGAMLLHPVAAAAVLVLLLNDHVLKAALPGVVTGKLSDVAGLAFFPLLLAEGAALVLRRDARGLVRASSGLTALAFALVKTTPAGASALAWALGTAQWLVALPLTGHAALRPVAVAMDPTDLIALPTVLAAMAIARRMPAPEPDRTTTVTRRRRFAPFAMAVIMASATMATTGEAPLPGVVVTEAMHLGRDASAIRHVTWTVQGTHDAVRLEVSQREVGDHNPAYAAGEVPGAGTVEIIPDDPTLSPVVAEGVVVPSATASLDLTSRCASGCSGGAQVRVRSSTAQLDIRLTTGRTADDVGLTLKDDGVGDFTGTPPSIDSGKVVTQVEIDTPQSVWTGGFTLHVSAAALQGPATGVRLLLQAQSKCLDRLYGYPLATKLTVGTRVEAEGSCEWWLTFDVSALCPAGRDCDIPARLEVRTRVANLPAPGATATLTPSGQAPAFSPTPRGYVDHYEWSVYLRLEALDGRALPAGSVTVTPDQP